MDRLRPSRGTSPLLGKRRGRERKITLQLCNQGAQRAHDDRRIHGDAVGLGHGDASVSGQIEHEHAVRQHIPGRAITDIEYLIRHVRQMPDAHTAAFCQATKNRGTENVTGRKAGRMPPSTRQDRQHAPPMAKRLLREPRTLTQLAWSVLQVEHPRLKCCKPHYDRAQATRQQLVLCSFSTNPDIPEAASLRP